MAGLQRFITYLYKYENDEKGANAGFAKTEIRGGTCRVEVHIRNTNVEQSECTVYLFVRKENMIQGISVGNLLMNRGNGDVSYVFDTKELLNFGITTEQLEGIFIPLDSKEYFASQWKEGEIRQGRFRIIEKEEAQQTAPRQQEAVAPQRVETPSRSRGIMQDRMAAPARQSQPNSASYHTKSAQPAAVYNPKLKQPATSYHTEPTQPATSYNTEATQPAASYNTELEQPTSSYNSELSDTTAASNNIEPQRTITEPSNIEQQHTTTEPSNTEQPLPNTASCNPETPTPDEPSINDEETLQATEIPMEQFFEESGWEGLFKKLRLKLNVFFPFEGEEIECVRMELKDMQEFPKKYWYLGNNSFLLHGFFNYKHVILGEITENGKKEYFIGVPGVFQNQERIMATMFGFPEFRTAKNVEQKTGNFGYWYRII